MKRTWLATDACGNTATTGQIILLLDTVKPTIRLVHPMLAGVRNGDTMTMDCGNMRIFNPEDAVATDNCDARPTMEFVDLSRRFGTCARDGYTLLMECAWKATDACGNVAFYKFFIKMTDNQVPVLSNNIPRDTAISLLQGQRIPTAPTNITATDNCTDNVQVTLAETQTPTAGGYILTRTWTATDQCGNAATGGQRITVLTGCTLPAATAATTASNCGAANGTVTLAIDNAANYRFVWSAGIAGATSNNRIGLTPGQYSVRVQRLSDTACMQILNFTIANDGTGCCSNFIAATAVVRTLNDCVTNIASTAEVCVEIPGNQITGYTIIDNGRPYNGGFGLCAAGSTMRFNAGDHTVIFTKPDGCKDTLSVTVNCVQEFQVERSIVAQQTGTWCPSELGLNQTFVGIENQCPTSSGTNVRYSINPVTRCVTYTGLTRGLDTACLLLRASDGRNVLVRLLVNTGACFQNIVAQDTIPAFSACVSDSVKACFDIPLDSMVNYVLLSDGYPYTSRFEGCKYDTTYAYTYFTVPGRGNSGPYRVDSWMMNGRAYSGVVANINVLVDSMNRWDVGGNWRMNSGTMTIVGGNHNNNYATMKITKINTGAFALLNLNRNLIPKATMIWVKTGRHTLTFIDNRTGCMDTAVVLGACVNPSTVQRTINVGQSETFCLDRTELLGNRYTSRAISSIPIANVNYSLNPMTHCVTFTGLAVGSQTASFVMCDQYGICDTTYFAVNVRIGLRIPTNVPVAQDDSATTTMGRPVVINVLRNDATFTNAGTAPPSVTMLLQPQHGTVSVNNLGQILYMPDANYCGSVTDRLMYVVCNGRGCDTAMVRIWVQCPTVRVNNGFSPNGDGINDSFTIEGLENYPNHKLQVFNRWGTEIYNAVQYKGNWEGFWDNTNLPEGTYFYILDLGDGEKPKSGYVQIQR
jgi:gliding motility-associated-like protein